MRKKSAPVSAGTATQQPSRAGKLGTWRCVILCRLHPPCVDVRCLAVPVARFLHSSQNEPACEYFLWFSLCLSELILASGGPKKKKWVRKAAGAFACGVVEVADAMARKFHRT